DVHREAGGEVVRQEVEAGHVRYVERDPAAERGPRRLAPGAADRVRREVDPGDVPPARREVERRRAGAAAEVQRALRWAARRLMPGDPGDDLRRHDARIPGGAPAQVAPDEPEAGVQGREGV